jgi:hypothetical protein
MITITDEERVLLVEAVQDFNDRLITQSINLAGQAFNNAFRLGCSVLALPVIVVLVVSYFANQFSFISIFVYGCAGSMLSLAFAAFVANRAKQISVDENYKDDVNPDILRFLVANDMNRAQFDAVADDILGDNAPLREFLIQPEKVADPVEEETTDGN